jgi:PTS system nitrogen regulatory IIA component
MELTVRQAADYLGVSESEARRWIGERGLPVHEANERLFLDPIELWEWAIAQDITVSRSLLEHARRASDEVSPISDLLRAGGVVYDIEATEKHGVLREFVARLPLPPEQERARLLTVLEARERMGSTAIGDGIAIPHMRNPIILDVEQPFVTLCLLRHPVEFDAVDGKPVHAVFMVVSPTVSVHLRVLAQLAFVLRDDVLRELLRERAPANQIIERIGMLQKTRTTAMFRAMDSDS